MYRLKIENLQKFQSEENKKAVIRAQYDYEYELKEQRAKVEQEIKDTIAQKELERQMFLRNTFLLGFGLLFIFASVVFVQRNKINKERKKSDGLLHNILPVKVADELKTTGKTVAQKYENVSILFTDFKDFTTVSGKMNPEELVGLIDTCFSAFDKIMLKHGVEKIKTIGDAYMAVGGLPVKNNTHAEDVTNAAIEIRNFIVETREEKLKTGQPFFDIRIGINTGPVVAGVVGNSKFAYDVWGDTVNVASRMESNGEPGKINISETTYELVKNKFDCFYRGEIDAKGKGKLKMYFIT